METHDLTQGTPEWHAHRRTHLNASDAPAMMGVSPYKTRTQLLDELATGIVPEVDDATQRRFDDGHRCEALARPLAEKIIGRSLYPIVGSEGKYGASFDGLTSDDAINFEHKRLNNELRAVFEMGDPLLPELYTIQMEQQHMVSGAEKTLFMASEWDDDGNLLEEYHCWYTPDPQLRDRIVAGWEQFEKDLAVHKPKVAQEMPQPDVSMDLPALFVNAHGGVTDSNLQEFGAALKKKLAEVREIPLVTDQDFSNAKETAKLFRERAKQMKQVKESMLAQTVTIGEASQMMDDWAADLNKTALQLEKDVEREDRAKKLAMIDAATLAFKAHVEGLEAETHPIRLVILRPDFGVAIKGKRNYASMQDAIDTALAHGKAEADAIAKDVRAKLAIYANDARGYEFLFSDLQTLIAKPQDDFTLVVNSRITQHKIAEAEKKEAALEAERQRIEAQAKAKAEREAAEKLAVEEARIRAEERAKAEAEAKELATEQAELEAKETDFREVLSGPPVMQESMRYITIGQINARLGFIVTADFLARLGFNFHASADKNAKLYRETDFQGICAALVCHINDVAVEHALKKAA